MTERIVVGLETQVPYHSRRIFNAFLQFLVDVEPTRLVGIGDHLDCPAPARWNRGTREEFEGGLDKQAATLRGMLAEIRDVYDGPFGMHTGNHEKRIEKYAKTHCPALLEIVRGLPDLLSYSELGIAELPEVANLVPGWVSTHGDTKGGGAPATVSRYAGGTAMSLARQWDTSVVCGHSHRLGHIQESKGFHCSRILHGVETGHMMDVRSAGYTAHPNWQSGWALLETGKFGVHVHLVSCSASGKVAMP